MTFSKAQQFCADQQRGATLAAVRDFTSLSAALPMDAGYIWIGLKSTPDQDGNLHWMDADRTPVTETNWKLLSYDEPDTADNGPDSDCVMVNGLKSEELYTVGEWGDYFCSYKARFLCALRV